MSSNFLGLSLPCPSFLKWIKIGLFYNYAKKIDFSATLVIRQGRITTHTGQASLELIQVVGIATVELGGNSASRPTYYFECITNLSMNDGSSIRWTRVGRGIPNRFDVEDIPGGNSTGKRLNVGGIGYADLGVYICSDSASNDAVSVNITGCK